MSFNFEPFSDDWVESGKDKPSKCQNCGEDELFLFYQGGKIEFGDFVEEYKCASCEAEGSVTGDAIDDPMHWEYEGEALTQD